MTRLEEIETRWTHFGRVGDDVDFLLCEVARTEKERERLSKLLIEARTEIVRLREGIEKALNEHEATKVLLKRIEELKEGIEKHRRDMWGHESQPYRLGRDIDEELYKLLEGK